MNNKVTLQTIDRDINRELRINNYLQLWNRDQLIQANKNIIGSSLLLSNRIGHLEKSFSSAIDNQTLILGSELSSINSKLTTVGLNLIAVEKAINLQTGIIKETLTKLDDIHETLKHPRETESKELFERGIQFIEKGFLAEAVESFNASLEKNPTNYMSHFYLGMLYLSGKDEDDDVIDYTKAEEEFKLAIKYSRPDADNLLVRQYIIAIHQNLSDLYYCLALSGKDPNNNYSLSYEELQKALKIDGSEDNIVNMTSRLIHCANKLGNSDAVLHYARIGFLNDASSLNYLVDDELAGYKTQFINIIDEVRPLIRDRINDCLIYEWKDNLETLERIISKTSNDWNSYTSLSFVFNILSKDEKQRTERSDWSERAKVDKNINKSNFTRLLYVLLSEYIILCHLNGFDASCVKRKEEQIHEVIDVLEYAMIKEDPSWLDVFDNSKLNSKIQRIENRDFVAAVDNSFGEIIRQYFADQAVLLDARLKGGNTNSIERFLESKKQRLVLPSGKIVDCSDYGFDQLNKSNIQKEITRIDSEKACSIAKEKVEDAKSEKKANHLLFLVLLFVLLFIISLFTGGTVFTLLSLLGGIVSIVLYFINLNKDYDRHHSKR